MDALALLRTVGALALVLGALAALPWAVRRFDLKLPGRPATRGRLALVERLALDPKRALLLVRRDGHEHLLLVGPEGAVTIETAIVHREPAVAPSPPARQTRRGRRFASLVEQLVATAERPRRAPLDLARNDACTGG